MRFRHHALARPGGSIGAVSLLQLETFVAVAEERNVGRAARRLHLSQPPVSRHLSALEAELGTRLFERTSRGMRLLPAGQALLPRARDILGAVEAARRAVIASAPPESSVDARPRSSEG